MERVATDGSVALTFQVSFKHNLPALYSESTADPDRKKKNSFTNTVSSLDGTLTEQSGSQTSRSVQTAAKASFFKGTKNICLF